ncbi:MAG TPA: OPT/YSL family transporter [Planctomycetota bacterium]|nr:OPT/YSL family transporter [Planctomycetota bacterium]
MSKDKLWADPGGARTPRRREPGPEQLDQESRDARVSRLGLTFGLVVSVLLGAALVVPAAKAGITPGVSPVVVLFGWVAFGAALGPGLKRFLAIAQVTGSGGAAVTAGVVFTAPVLQIIAANQGLAAPAVDIGLLTLGSLSGALLGFGFVGFATSRFLTDASLPAPEAVACDRMIRTAVEKPDERPALGISLVAGLVAGAAVTLMTSLNWLAERVHSFGLRVFAKDADQPADVNIPIPVSPIYLGIGALLTLPTAILIFGGGLVNSFAQGYSASHGLPATTYRWVGGAAMAVAVLYSLVMYAVEGRRKSRADHDKSRARHDSVLAAAKADAGPRVGLPDITTYPDWQLRQSTGIKRMLWACIWSGTALLLLMLWALGASLLSLAVLGVVAFVLAFLLSGLGGLLSLQVGASASPVSGTVFMGLLVLSVTALAIGLEGMAGVAILVPLVVATCVAICAANDSSQDYKTVQLNGFKVSDSFFGHLLGLLAGALIVPATLSMAHAAYTLGSTDLPCPQAGFFSTVLQSLFLEAEIPWGPVGVGALLGLLAVGMDAYGKRRGIILSALAFAVGIYLTPAAGVGMMLGALARWLPKRKLGASTHEGVLIAAGLITGEAICQLALGGAILSGVSMPGGEGEPRLANFIGLFLLGFILALIYRNNAKGRAAEGGGH